MRRRLRMRPVSELRGRNVCARRGFWGRMRGHHRLREPLPVYLGGLRRDTAFGLLRGHFLEDMSRCGPRSSCEASGEQPEARSPLPRFLHSVPPRVLRGRRGADALEDRFGGPIVAIASLEQPGATRPWEDDVGAVVLHTNTGQSTAPDVSRAVRERLSRRDRRRVATVPQGRPHDGVALIGVLPEPLERRAPALPHAFAPAAEPAAVLRNRA